MERIKRRWIWLRLILTICHWEEENFSIPSGVSISR
jgi:hypothetical protein